MTRGIYWGVGLLILLIGVGAFVFYSQYSELQQLKQDAAETDKLREEHNKPKVVAEAQRQPPPGASPEGHWHGDEWHDSAHETPFKDVIGVQELPRTAIPEDIPEHLKLPAEWVDGHYSGLEDPKPEYYKGTAEDVSRFTDILKEIIRDYNPKRPLSEIWSQYIANEKMYRAVAESDLGYTPLSGYAFNRVDWLYEQTWAFPEVMELILFAEEPPHGEENKAQTTLRIEMGELNPDWNFFRLADDRPFFVKGETKYNFVYKGLTEEGLPWQRKSGFYRGSNLRNPEKTVTIDVYNTSDEELKRLGGWDYSMNPLTLQPIQYERYNTKYKE